MVGILGFRLKQEAQTARSPDLNAPEWYPNPRWFPVGDKSLKRLPGALVFWLEVSYPRRRFPKVSGKESRFSAPPVTVARRQWFVEMTGKKGCCLSIPVVSVARRQRFLEITMIQNLHQ